MKVTTAFHFEIKAQSLTTAERTQNPICLKSSTFVHSQWGFGPLCSLLLLVCCVSSCPDSTQHLQGGGGRWRGFHSTLCFCLLTSFAEMLMSFSSRTVNLPKVPKRLPAGFPTSALLRLFSQPGWSPWRSMWCCRQEDKRHLTNYTDELKAFRKPQQRHRMVTSMALSIEKSSIDYFSVILIILCWLYSFTHIWCWIFNFHEL